MARAQEASPVREGDVIAGKYRVERVLGMGGMGVVVAAVHMQLKQRVAIKFLLPDAASSPETVTRFLREAQAAALIKSEHVARVIDVATLEDGLPYMVMEFLEGSDLAQVLADRGPLPVEEAVGYMLQACEGVAEAHAAGIVHRDIKPSNLFVTGRPGGRTTVKVLDFGISKLQDLTLSASGEGALTKTSNVMGSPLYMSPEQMTSAKHVDTRTDVWSLGVTLFELLSGTTPFRGDTVTELVAAVLQKEPRAIHELRQDLPPGFSEALSRALAKDRDQRYTDVGAFATAFAPFGPRLASLRVERIAEVLASTPPPARALSSPPTARSPGSASSERLGYESTAAFSGDDRQAASAVPGTTAKPVSSDRADHAGRPAKKSSNGAVVGVAAAIALAGIAGTVVLRGRAQAPAQAVPEPAVTTSPSVVPPAPEPSVTARAVLPILPEASAAEPMPAPPVAAGAPASAQKPGTPHHAAPAAPPPTAQPASAPSPAALPKAAAAAPAASSATPTCRVVKYFDADGEVRFKKECP